MRVCGKRLIAADYSHAEFSSRRYCHLHQCKPSLFCYTTPQETAKLADLQFNGVYQTNLCS